MTQRTDEIDFNLADLINYSSTAHARTAELDNIVVATGDSISHLPPAKPARKRKRGKDRPSTLVTPFSALETGPVRDMEAFVNRSRQVREKEALTSKKAKRSATMKPPRPWNSFILYRAAYSQRIKDWAGANSNQAVSKLAAESWSIEPKDIQDHYVALAAIEKENHAAAFPGYKYKPSKPRNLKYESDYEDDYQSESERYDDDDEYRPSKRPKRPLRTRSPRRTRPIKRPHSVEREFVPQKSRRQATPASYTEAVPWLHNQQIYDRYPQLRVPSNAPWMVMMPPQYTEASSPPTQIIATSNPYYVEPSYRPTMQPSQSTVQLHSRQRQATPYPEADLYRIGLVSDHSTPSAASVMPPPDHTPSDLGLSKFELERLMTYKLPTTPRTPATPAFSLFSSLFPISPRALNIVSPPLPGSTPSPRQRVIDITSSSPLLGKILTDSAPTIDLLTQSVTIDPQLLAWDREGSYTEGMDRFKVSKSED